MAESVKQLKESIEINTNEIGRLQTVIAVDFQKEEAMAEQMRGLKREVGEVEKVVEGLKKGL